VSLYNLSFLFFASAECGGKIFATLKPRYITSPGYNDKGYYDDYMECSWLIKVH